jgi:hypothetical protein
MKQDDDFPPRSSVGYNNVVSVPGHADREAGAGDENSISSVPATPPRYTVTVAASITVTVTASIAVTFYLPFSKLCSRRNSSTIKVLQTSIISKTHFMQVIKRTI